VARKWLSEIPKATYVLSGIGILLFVLGRLLRFWPSLTLGVLLLAASVLRLVPLYLTDIKPGEGLLTAISATWAILFAAWCVAWLLVPAVHMPLISVIVGMVIAGGAFVLAYFTWRKQDATL